MTRTPSRGVETTAPGGAGDGTIMWLAQPAPSITKTATALRLIHILLVVVVPRSKPFPAHLGAPGSNLERAAWAAQ